MSAARAREHEYLVALHNYKDNEGLTEAVRNKIRTQIDFRYSNADAAAEREERRRKQPNGKEAPREDDSRRIDPSDFI